MEASVRVPSRDKHLGHLDALRGIAILGVLLVHSAILTRQDGLAFSIGFTGQRGVQLFYMISAFTLCLSLDGERREQHPLSNYFIRRIFRIVPLFYVVILANILLKHIAPNYSSLRDLSHLDVLLGFLFLNGARPQAINSVVSGGWSIAVETTFYLMLPLLHRYFNTVRRALLLFVLTAPVLGLLSRWLALHAVDSVHEQYFAFLWFPVEFPVFVLGILTYCLWKQYISGQMRASNKQKDASLLLIATSFMLYCACLPFTDFKLYFSSYLFLPLILGLSIYPWPALVNPFTRFIGKISYSLYLLHFFVLQLLISLLIHIDRRPGHLISRYIYARPSGFALLYFALLGLTLPICVLSWKFLEQPGIRFGRRLIARREGRATRADDIPLIPSLHTLEAVENSRDAQF